MPLVNDGYGCVREEANPYTGKAELFWRPLDPIKDNADAKGSESPDWSEGDRAWDYKSILTLVAKEWSYDEKPPFSWYVTTRPATTWFRGYAGEWANVETTIYVFVAPHVEVKRTPLSLGYWYREPDIHIVRVDSILEVPPPGREPNLGLLLGDRPTLEYFYGRLSAGDLMDEVNANAVYDPADSLSIPDVRIRRDLLSFIVEKPTHYQIKINLSEQKPSFFRIAIVQQTGKKSEIKLPPGWEDHMPIPVLTEKEINATLFRVIHDANTTVEFKVNGGAKSGLSHVRAMLETRKVYHRPQWETRPITPSWATDEAVPETASIIVKDQFFEPDYYDFTSGTWTEIEADPDWFGVDTLFQLGIGFIPVVGQLYDVADIVSVAVTGKDLWGAKRSKTDIVLMGGFAMLGVLGDLSKHVDIGVMTRIGDYLFPGAKLVSQNPNFARFLVRAAFSGTPAFTLAGEVLAKKHGDEFMRELDRLIRAGDEAGVAALARKFEAEFDAVMRSNAKDLLFHEQPATVAMLREYRERFGTLLKNTPDTSASKTDEIIKIWDAAHANGTLAEVIQTIRGIDSKAADALVEGLREQIIFDINSDPTIIRHATAYVGRYGLKGFFAKHKVPFSPFTYLTKVTQKGTGVRDAFNLKYGDGAWEIITGRRSRPDPDAMIARYKGQIGNLLNNIDTYFNHRRMIREDYSGLGIILNSDHIIEARFRKVEAYPGSVDGELFRAMLVPPSLDIARKLRDEGIEIGWYIHQHKTSRMNQLLPQRQADYTIAEIAEAYQLFWVHEMKMTPNMFRNMFEEELQFLDMARKGTHVMEGTHNPNAGKFIFTSFKPKGELLKTVNARLKKMGLPEFVEAKVGERVSDAPGLG